MSFQLVHLISGNANLKFNTANTKIHHSSTMLNHLFPGHTLGAYVFSIHFNTILWTKRFQVTQILFVCYYQLSILPFQ